MEERDTYRLFLNVAKHSGQNTDAIRSVFSLLVRSTLRYRDIVLESKGVVVTVEDVRTVLGWLVPSLASGRLPETDNKIRLDLLKIWLDELKLFGNPGIYLSSR
ncbi:MAG: hypothetical protein JRJ23_11630 [Deltaproteobacteria bacterium]|nr:hypothetical protein [Deltaproteobacteria bacterium]